MFWMMGFLMTLTWNESHIALTTQLFFSDSVVQRSLHMSGAKADAELRSKTDNLERMITEVMCFLVVNGQFGDFGIVGDY